MNYVGTDGGSVFESRQKGLDERVSATVGSARSCPGKLAWNLQVRFIISSIEEIDAKRFFAMTPTGKPFSRRLDRPASAPVGECMPGS